MTKTMHKKQRRSAPAATTTPTPSSQSSPPSSFSILKSRSKSLSFVMNDNNNNQHNHNKSSSWTQQLRYFFVIFFGLSSKAYSSSPSQPATLASSLSSSFSSLYPRSPRSMDQTKIPEKKDACKNCWDQSQNSRRLSTTESGRVCTRCNSAVIHEIHSHCMDCAKILGSCPWCGSIPYVPGP